MSLSDETKALYASKIDVILANSDLNTISAKRIRKQLQEDFDTDLSQQKNEINGLISSRFDAIAADKGVIAPSSPPEPVVLPATTTTSSTTTITNGLSSSTIHNGTGTGHYKPSPSPSKPSAKRLEDSDEMSDVIDEKPPKKKPKPIPMDDDAAFAARLQAEENSRARPTRGNGQVKKRATVKKNRTPKQKQKSASKIKADDDSELDSDSQDGKAKKKSGAFHKPQHLSPPLAELLGENIMSRPQTVKGIWDYVKKNELQNPNDKRQIMCDDALRAVFKRDSVHMFTMNKILSTLLTPVDEAT